MNQSTKASKEAYFILREAGAAGPWPWVDIKDAGTELVRRARLQATQVLTSKWQLLQKHVLRGTSPWPLVAKLPVPPMRHRKGNVIGVLRPFAGPEKLMRPYNL